MLILLATANIIMFFFSSTHVNNKVFTSTLDNLFQLSPSSFAA